MRHNHVSRKMVSAWTQALAYFLVSYVHTVIHVHNLFVYT